jgi:hypothetical protein
MTIGKLTPITPADRAAGGGPTATATAVASPTAESALVAFFGGENCQVKQLSTALTWRSSRR